MPPRLKALLPRLAPALAVGLLALQALLSLSSAEMWAGWAAGGELPRSLLGALQGEALVRSAGFSLLVLLWVWLRRRDHRAWPERTRLAGLGVLGLGALVGLLFGRTSTHDLRPGEGVEVAGTVVRLVQSEAHPAPEGLALAVLPPDGKGGFEAPRRALPVEVGLGVETGLGDLQVRAEEVIPNALPSGEMAADPTGASGPALRVMLGLGGTTVPEGWMPARDPRRNRFDAPGEAFAVCFREVFSQALLEELRPRLPKESRLVLVVQGRVLTHDASPGTAWNLPGFRLAVERLFPDFVAEPGPDGRPRFGTRSQEPRNPWLQVRLTQAGGSEAQLLLATRPPADPSYAAYLRAALPPGTELRYVRDGEERQSRFVLFTQGDAKVRLVAQGRVVREAPLELGRPFVVARGLSAVPMALLPSARFEDRWRPQADPALARQPLNPAVRVKVGDPAGRQEEGWVAEGEGARSFLSGKLALRLQPRVAGPGSTRALLALDDGEPRWATVASPLRRGLLAVTADQEAPLEPGRTRVRLVRDPGRPLRLLGLSLLLLGWVAGIFPTRRIPEGR